MTRYTRDGTLAKPAMLKQLEIDAVELLRRRDRTGEGMKARLSARAYLMQKGWPVERINAAQDTETEGP